MTITNRFRNVLIMIGLITVLIILIWLVPRVGSIYFQGKGSQLLMQTLSQSPTTAKADLICNRLPVLNEPHRTNLASAKEDIQRSILMNNSNSYSYLMLGRISCLIGDYGRAIDALSVYTELRPKNPEGYVELGLAYKAINELEKAREEWTKADLTLNEYVAMGDLARQKNRLDDSIYWYKLARDLFPNTPEPYYGLGTINEFMGEWENALAAFQEGIMQAGEKTYLLSSLYYHIGWLYQNHLGGSSETILEAYDKALEINSYFYRWEQIQTHFNRAEIFRIAKNYQEALLEYEWVINNAPDSHPTKYRSLGYYGVLNWMLHGDVALAREMFNQSTQIDPDSRWAYEWMGNIYEENGGFTEAMNIYNMYLQLQPDDEDFMRKLKTISNREN